MTRDASNPEFKKALFAELEEVLGGELSSDMAQKVEDVENTLRPMFVALPKNAEGKLDHSAVKYVLRRLFMQRQGWVVGGLEPTLEAADPSQSASIIEDWAPEMVQELFKKHIGVDGSGLHEIAVVAAMMEHLIFEDMLGKLLLAYRAKRIDPELPVSKAQAMEVLGLHMASFIRARDVSEWTPEQIAHFEKLIYVLYPNWKRTLELMVEVQERVAPDVHEFTFDVVANIAQEIGSLFAHWQNDECKSTKDLLLEMEDRDTGRVRLVDFYNAALYKGRYQFTEAINYLRHLGTLDETDELNPRVIIPNYVTGRSNCVARTGYYSVCCLDGCEDLFGQLERQLGKPTASADEITVAIEGLSSAPSGGVSRQLRRRLDEVGKHHGGAIPLHGRLFAQWMHLAFPHECSYPHKTGTVYYNSMEQWETETGQRSGSTMQEIEHWSNHLSQLDESRTDSAAKDHEEDHLSGMWSMEEELVTVRAAPVETEDSSTDKGSSSQLFIRGAGFLAAVAAAVMLGRYQGASSTKKGGLFDSKASIEKWSV